MEIKNRVNGRGLAYFFFRKLILTKELHLAQIQDKLLAADSVS